MKKMFFLFATLLNISAALAFDTNSVFSFKQQDSSEGYQQYVGKSFFFRPSYGSYETWYKSGFKYDMSYEDKLYTISKISVKDVRISNNPNREITIEAVQNGSKSKVKFKSYEKVSVKIGFWLGDERKLPLIDCMPIVFTEPFNEFKQKHMSEIIEHKMVKDVYEVVDVFIGKDIKDDAATASVNVSLKNKRTGKIVKCPYNQVNTIPFNEALEGSYKMALIEVEKPEDSTNRYSETKTIQDDNVDKFSYNDSIIDLTIFGTKENFRFSLKNISNHSIKIVWNDAAFVGLDGSTSKIMHTGIKYSERESDQPATVIIKGAKIDDSATPTANVYYDEGLYLPYTGKTIGNGWKTKSMIPEKHQGKEAGIIRLMLPIQVKDVVNEYTFVFRVYYAYNHPELLNADQL